MAVNAALAFLPVVLFLVVLVLMDSFKLARPSAIATALVWGVVAALLGDAVYGSLGSLLPLSPTEYSRFIAPAVEESLKAAFIAYLLLRRRIGFPVDAAQLGFAVGTGFAVIENYQYLRALPDAGMVLWAVRGLGTGDAARRRDRRIRNAVPDCQRAAQGQILARVPAWMAGSRCHSRRF
jgi:RsiW-degrading membrane proteinase PrsW (M82 family)